MKVLSSRTVYKGRIFRLDKDIIEMNGRKITREIIHHPGSSLMIPVLDVRSKKIVLIEQYRYAAGGNIFEFPAGTLDRGETHRKCAARELIEETGFKAGKLTQVSRFYLAPGTMTEVMAMFMCLRLEMTKQNLMPDEKIKNHITTLDRAVKMVFSGAIKDAKTIAAVMILSSIYADKKLFKKYLG